MKIIKTLLLLALFGTFSCDKKVDSNATIDSKKDTVAPSKDTTLEVPKQFSLTGPQDAVRDQGNRNSCTSFAYLTCIENELKNFSGQSYNLSEEYVTYFAKMNKSNSELSDINDIFEASVAHGFVQENDWPYQYSYFSMGYPCQNEEMGVSENYMCYAHQTPPQQVIDKSFKINNLKIRYCSPPFDDARYISMCNVIYTKKIMYGVSFPHKAFYDVDELNSNGVLKYSDTLTRDEREDSILYHYAAIVGFDLDKKHFIVKNSWGKNWGVNGYGFISFDMMRKYGGMYRFLIDSKETIKLPPLASLNTPEFTNFKANALVLKDKSIALQLNSIINNIGHRRLEFKSQFYITEKIKEKENKKYILFSKEEQKQFSIENAGIISTYQFKNPAQKNVLTSENLKDFVVPKEQILSNAFQKAIKNKSQKLYVEIEVRVNDDIHPEKVYAKKTIEINKSLLHSALSK